MPLVAYFAVMGATLLVLLNLSSYALLDVGSPIKTSQLAGLPKVKPRPDAEPLTLSTFNFGAPKESTTSQLPDTIYAKDTSSLKGQGAIPARHRQTESKDKSAPRERRAGVYSHDAMMDIH